MVVEDPGLGPAAARNEGARRAAGDVLNPFTDAAVPITLVLYSLDRCRERFEADRRLKRGRAQADL